MLESGAMSEADMRREMKWLRHGVNVMSEITNDVLDIRALSSGKLRLRSVLTNLRELLERCAQRRVNCDVCDVPRAAAAAASAAAAAWP